jgi:hypothetical protein
MNLEEFLALTESKGEGFNEKKEREGHMKRIYACAEHLGISERLTPEIVELIVKAYDIKKHEELASEYEHSH